MSQLSEDSSIWKDNKQIICMLQKNGDNFPEKEVIKLRTQIIKINKKCKEQQRILLITDKALYNIKPNNLKQCQRRIDLQQLASITSSLLSLQFTINIPQEYDYRFKANSNKQKNKIIQTINTLYFKLQNRKLNIHKIQQSSTITHTVTKNIAKLLTREEKLQRWESLTNGGTDNSVSAMRNMSHSLCYELLTFGYIRMNSEYMYKLFVPYPVYSLVFEHLYIEFGVKDLNIKKLISSNGAGVVFKVEQKCKHGTNIKSKKYFAMKVYNKKLKFEWDMLKIRETRRYWENIDHPYIVKLHFAFQTKTRLYLGFDYYQFHLCFILRKKRRFKEEIACLWAAEIASAVGYLHSKQIFRISIKPEDIMLDNYGHCHLVDIVPLNFNMMNGNECWKYDGSICEPPDYCSYEEVSNLPTTKDADWWRLGILIYELCVGIPPFYSQNLNEMYNKICSAPLLFPPNVSDEYKSVCQYLLQRKVEHRLGYGENDYLSVLQHEWFKSIDINKLEQKIIKSKFVPSKQQQHHRNDHNVIAQIMKDDNPYTTDKGKYANFTLDSILCQLHDS